MARVDLQDAWTVPGDVASVEQKLMGFLGASKMQVLHYQPGQMIQAKQGSQLWTRLAGGWFVPASVLPKQATVTISQGPDGVNLNVTIEESLGLGSIIGMKNKYYNYFVKWMQNLKQALAY